MSVVRLSNAQVEIVDKITWGQKETIKNTMMAAIRANTQGGDDKTKEAQLSLSADAMFAAKCKAIEVCIVKITQDDKEVLFSRQWLESLSIEDGDALHDAIEAVTDPAKK